MTLRRAVGASGGRVLIVEQGGTRGALAAVRSLGMAGWTVAVGTPSGAGIAAASRYTKACHVVPAPNEDDEGFLAALESAIREGGYDIVMAGGDAELMAISAGRDRLSACVPHASHGTVTRALDKLELAEAGRLAGWSVPATELALPGQEPTWGSPAVVKARWHFSGAGGGRPARIEAALGEQPSKAAMLAQEIRAVGGEPLFQSHQNGRLAAFVAVCAEGGEIVASAAQVAEATSPSPLGASVRARSTEVDGDLQRDAEALLVELGWFGLAEIQYLLDEEGNRWLIDLNARLYGSLQLAISAGADLPAAWAAVATGRALPANLNGEAGVGYSWLGGGLARTLDARRGRAASELFQALRPRRRSIGPVWMTGDPRPAMTSVRRTVARSGKIRARWMRQS